MVLLLAGSPVLGNPSTEEVPIADQLIRCGGLYLVGASMFEEDEPEVSVEYKTKGIEMLSAANNYTDMESIKSEMKLFMDTLIESPGVIEPRWEKVCADVLKKHSEAVVE